MKQYYILFFLVHTDVCILIQKGTLYWLKPTDHDNAKVFHAMFNSIAIMCYYVQYNLKIKVILMPETHLLQFSKFKD